MTADDQIEKLEDRVTRLEDRTNSEIVAIHTKLDALLTLVNKAMVESAKHTCPAPGSCLVIGESLKSTITAHNATMLRVERLELRMMDIERWQGKLLGGIAVIIGAATLFGPVLRKFLKLE